ncbi:hypothetical protein Hanom_Chr09g00852651 [Helianthus anomalus]
MEVTSRMKMVRFQTICIQMQKNKPLNESHKTGQTSGTKMTFYSFFNNKLIYENNDLGGYMQQIQILSNLRPVCFIAYLSRFYLFDLLHCKPKPNQPIY